MELPVPCVMEKSTCWLVVDHAALLVEGQPAGLHVDLARRGGLGGSGQRLGVALAFTPCPAWPWAQSPAPPRAASA